MFEVAKSGIWLTKTFKAALISMFKELKETMFKELEESTMMSYQIENKNE